MMDKVMDAIQIAEASLNTHRAERSVSFGLDASISLAMFHMRIKTVFGCERG